MDGNGVTERDCDIYLFDRKKAELTGISDVIGFTDSNITLNCKFGVVTIDGRELKIVSFDSESGKLSVTGTVDSIFYYGEPSSDKKGRKRLFG